MRHFNAAVHLCASAPFALAQSEQQQILTLLLSNAQQLARSDTLLVAVQQQNLAATTLAEIRRQDTLWQQQLLQGQTEGSLAHKLLETKASTVLRSMVKPMAAAALSSAARTGAAGASATWLHWRQIRKTGA